MEYILDTLAKVGFEWKMGLFNFINFMIIFFILKRYAFKPIMKTIDERQKKMTEGIENYDKSKSELQMAEQKAQEIVDNAKIEGNKSIEKAHDEAKSVGNEMRDKAKEEIELLIVQAKKNIDIDKKEMKESLRKETIDIVVLAIEKILAEKMDSKMDEKYIKSILSSLK
jgi:F-type H+-transporting ATPase subunit b